MTVNMRTITAVSIYQFDDFRVYLKHRFDTLKAADQSLTHRAFALKAGFSNPGYFNDVIKSRRTLSKTAAEKLISVFSLPPVEADFFKLLVKYCQAKNNDVRQTLYHAIVSRRNRSAFSHINPALTRYYQDYRYPLVRNALMAYDFKGHYEEFARFIQPALPSAVVKKCVRDLCDWGLVRQDSHGRFIATDRFIEPPSTLNEQLRQINRDWITHGIDALMSLSQQKRHVSSRLLTVSPAVAKKIAQRLESFRDEIWEMVKSDTEKASCVMQLNIQYFPRTRLGANEPSTSSIRAPRPTNKEQI